MRVQKLHEFLLETRVKRRDSPPVQAESMQLACFINYITVMTYSVPRMRPTDRHTNRSGTSRQNQLQKRLSRQNSRLRMARAPREFPEVEGGVAFEVRGSSQETSTAIPPFTQQAVARTTRTWTSSQNI